MISYMIGGSSDPAPPIIENPKPNFLFLLSFTYLMDFSSMSEEDIMVKKKDSSYYDIIFIAV